MNKSTFTSKPVTTTSAAPGLSRIVSRAEPTKKTEALAKAGEYRVIHGNIMVPRFARRADATAAKENGEPTQEMARQGDVVYLTAEDATRMLAANIVETLDAKPSRVGKVWEPPKPIRNKNSLGSAQASA